MGLIHPSQFTHLLEVYSSRQLDVVLIALDPNNSNERVRKEFNEGLTDISRAFTAILDNKDYINAVKSSFRGSLNEIISEINDREIKL